MEKTELNPLGVKPGDKVRSKTYPAELLTVLYVQPDEEVRQTCTPIVTVAFPNNDRDDTDMEDITPVYTGKFVPGQRVRVADVLDPEGWDDNRPEIGELGRVVRCDWYEDMFGVAPHEDFYGYAVQLDREACGDEFVYNELNATYTPTDKGSWALLEEAELESAE